MGLHGLLDRDQEEPRRTPSAPRDGIHEQDAGTRLNSLVDLEGWEIVIEPDAQGVLTKFRFDEVGPHQTLIKKRN